MREYIVNLTNNLIRKNRYDEIFTRMNNPGEFLTHIALDLESDDVKDMSPETLGKIMCAFEIGDVMSGHPGKEVKFSGDCEDLLREIVALCLAYVVRGRIEGQLTPPYESSPGSTSAIKSALAKAKRKEDESMDKGVEQALRVQKVCQEFLDYLKSAEGKEALELIALVPNQIFTVAAVSFTDTTRGCSNSRTFACAYNCGFFRTSEDVPWDKEYWKYKGEKHSAMTRLDAGQMTKVLEDFKDVLDTANSTYPGLNPRSELKGKTIEDFVQVFKKSVENFCTGPILSDTNLVP